MVVSQRSLHSKVIESMCGVSCVVLDAKFDNDLY